MLGISVSKADIPFSSVRLVLMAQGSITKFPLMVSSHSFVLRVRLLEHTGLMY